MALQKGIFEKRGGPSHRTGPQARIAKLLVPKRIPNSSAADGPPESGCCVIRIYPPSRMTGSERIILWLGSSTPAEPRSESLHSASIWPFEKKCFRSTVVFRTDLAAVLAARSVVRTPNSGVDCWPWESDCVTNHPSSMSQCRRTGFRNSNF